jgi:hypothetical protein
MKTLEQITKEKEEIERRLLFLQHKDRHNHDDDQACYNMNQAILKLARQIRNYEGAKNDNHSG